MNIINGYSYPRFICDNGARSVTIDLPLTGEEGLVETDEIVEVSHLLTTYEIRNSVQGVRLHFSLSYKQYATGDTMMKIKDILNYYISGYTITLMPRVDNASRYYPVKLSNPSIAYGILKGGANAIGHRLMSLEFQTTNLIPLIDWVKISVPPGVIAGGKTTLNSPLKGTVMT